MSPLGLYVQDLYQTKNNHNIGQVSKCTKQKCSSRPAWKGLPSKFIVEKSGTSQVRVGPLAEDAKSSRNKYRVTANMTWECKRIDEMKQDKGNYYLYIGAPNKSVKTEFWNKEVLFKIYSPAHRKVPLDGYGNSSVKNSLPCLFSFPSNWPWLVRAHHVCAGNKPTISFDSMTMGQRRALMSGGWSGKVQGEGKSTPVDLTAF